MWTLWWVMNWEIGIGVCALPCVKQLSRGNLGEGNGTPLQYSCLENPMDGGAWWLQSMGLLRVRHNWAISLSLSCIGEGNGNPLQCSCLENPRDGGAWWEAVYGVTQSRTRLKWLSSSSSSRGNLLHSTGSSAQWFCDDLDGWDGEVGWERGPKGVILYIYNWFTYCRN